MGIPLFTSATSHLKFAHERCVTSCSLERTVCHRNSAFKHTIWSTMLSPCKRWRHSDAVRLTRSGSRKKNWRVHFCHQGWGRQRYLTPRLRGDMATPTTIALDSSFNLLLKSRILVNNDGNCQHHVVQISRTKYIMKCYHDMVDQIPPKRILWPWNQWESHCLHRRPHIRRPQAAPSWSPGAARQPTRELMSTTHTYPWLIP